MQINSLLFSLCIWKQKGRGKNTAVISQKAHDKANQQKNLQAFPKLSLEMHIFSSASSEKPNAAPPNLGLRINALRLLVIRINSLKRN